MNTHRTRRTVRVSLVVAVLLVSVVALSIAFAGTAVAQETLVVDGDADDADDDDSLFETIQEAVNDANNGDTVEINVTDDPYVENVTVDTDNLTIQGNIENGDKPTVYWSETDDPVFTIESGYDNVTVRDLRIEAQNEDNTGIDVGFGSGHKYIENIINGFSHSDTGIQIEGDSSVVLDNEITNFNQAIRVSRSDTTNITIADNNIADVTGRDAITVTGSVTETTIESNRLEDAGSTLNDRAMRISGPDTNIHNNEIYDSGIGIVFDNSAKGSNATGNTFEGTILAIRSARVSSLTIESNEINESRGIRIVGASNNVVRNNNVTDGSTGIQIDGSSDPAEDNLISGNNISGIEAFASFPGIGIELEQTEGTTVQDNHVLSSEASGIFLNGSSNNEILDNTANDNGNYGIALDESDDNLIENNTAFGNFAGIYSFNATGNEIIGNTANENTADSGIWLEESDGNEVIGNTANGNEWGIALWPDSSDNLVENNTANNNGFVGIHLYVSSDGNTVVDNTVNNNDDFGFRIAPNSDNNELRNNTAQNNGWDISIEEDSVGTVVENLDIGDSTAADTTLSFEAEDVQLRSNSSPPVDPADAASIDRYFDAEDTDEDAFLDVELSYLDENVEDVDEESLELRNFDGTEWITVPDSGVDTENNVVFANITEFSTFGAFAEQSEPEPESEPTRSSSSSSGSSSSLPPNAFAQRTMQIRDSSHGTPGTTVDIGLAGADSITFSDEDASGLLTARAYNAVPTDAPAVCEYQPFIAGYQFDVPADQATQPATIQFTVDGDDLADADVSADQLTVIYAPTDAEACESLETTVIDSNGDVTLEVETPGFSTFVISSTDEPEPTAESELEPEEDEEEPAEPDETEQTEDNIPGFGVAIAVLVTLLSAALVVRRSGRRQ